MSLTRTPMTRSQRSTLPRTLLAGALLFPSLGAALPAMGDEPMTQEEAVRVAESLVTDKVVVVDAGSGDKSVLQLAPERRDESRFQTRQSVALTTSMGGQQMPSQAVPVSTTVIRNRVDEVSPDGSFQVTATVESAKAEETPGVDPRMVESMNMSLGAMVGMSETFAMLLDGSHAENAEVNSPDGDSEPEMGAIPGNQVRRELTRQMLGDYLRLPGEAVGEGAVWRRKFEMTMNGITAVVIATGTLVNADEETLEVEHDVAMLVSGQTLDDVGPPGSEVKVTEGFGTGDGRVVIDRRTASPVSGSMVTVLDVALSMAMGEQAQEVSQNIETTMEYSVPE